MIELATRGLPAVGVATDQFGRFARQVLAQRSAGALPLAVIAHPLGGIPAADARARVTDDVLAAVVHGLTEANGGPER